jgi:hypothetical protein
LLFALGLFFFCKLISALHLRIELRGIERNSLNRRRLARNRRLGGRRPIQTEDQHAEQGEMNQHRIHKRPRVPAQQ